MVARQAKSKDVCEHTVVGYMQLIDNMVGHWDSEMITIIFNGCYKQSCNFWIWIHSTPSNLCLNIFFIILEPHLRKRH